MPATIKDVARLAGVSIKTVSRVINGEAHVSDDTRVRVQSAIRAAGYAPNISARRLVQNKSYMLCILTDPSFFPPASSLFNIAQDPAAEAEYDILIQPYFPTRAISRQKLVNLIFEHRIDGFVTTPPCDSEGFVADLLNTYKVPLVQINPITRNDTIPAVYSDDRQGAYELMSYLISLGHRRICFLGGPRTMRASVERLEGYKAALQANLIPNNPGDVLESGFSFEGGYQAARKLLSASPRPTAVFAGSDEAAYGAMFAAQEAGLSIPRDLSVCGFDDLSLSKNVWPGLTTVLQPFDKIVEAATRLLIHILQHQNSIPQQLWLPTRLVIRGSSTAPPIAPV